MDYRYKPGDKVRVKECLYFDEGYLMRSGPSPNIAAGFVPDMGKFCGKIVMISGYRKDRYQLEEDTMNWLWTDDMFENLDDKPFVCKNLL